MLSSWHLHCIIMFWLAVVFSVVSNRYFTDDKDRHNSFNDDNFICILEINFRSLVSEVEETIVSVGVDNLVAYSPSLLSLIQTDLNFEHAIVEITFIVIILLLVLAYMYMCMILCFDF